MKLKEYLSTKKIKHTDFAADLGVSQVTVTRYVNGERKPSLSMALKIEDITKRKVRVSDWFDVSGSEQTEAAQ
jgi:transcriptional regulator with XRE-family HTH domain